MSTSIGGSLPSSSTPSYPALPTFGRPKSCLSAPCGPALPFSCPVPRAEFCERGVRSVYPPEFPRSLATSPASHGSPSTPIPPCPLPTTYFAPARCAEHLSSTSSPSPTPDVVLFRTSESMSRIPPVLTPAHDAPPRVVSSPTLPNLATPTTSSPTPFLLHDQQQPRRDFYYAVSRASETPEDIEPSPAYIGQKKKYKPVTLKVRPVKTDLPSQCCIVRNIIGDPLADMPLLDLCHIPDFISTG